MGPRAARIRPIHGLLALAALLLLSVFALAAPTARASQELRLKGGETMRVREAQLRDGEA